MDIRFDSSLLPNGIRCTTASMPRMESLGIGLWVVTGSRYETAQEGGISHFIEHMLFKGTGKRSALEISKAIEGIGGSLNAFTSEETTCYTAVVRKKHLETALEILADMLLHSRFDPEDIRQERQVIQEELKMHQDNPSQYVFDLLGEALWPDQPLGRPIVGTHETLEGIGGPEFTSYMARHYRPSAMVLAVGGDVDQARVRELADTYLPLPSGGEPPQFAPAVETQTRPQVIVRAKDIEQVHLCLGLRSFARTHPDRYALKLLSVALGENMSSRLFQQVREKRGLSYDIQSSLNPFRDTGALVISAGVHAKRLTETLEVILSECRAVASEGLGDEELERAREYVLGGLVMGTEKTFRNMMWAAEHLIDEGQIPTPGEIMDRIQRVTPGDIRRVAQTLFAGARLNAAFLGPVREKREALLQTVTLA